MKKTINTLKWQSITISITGSLDGNPNEMPNFSISNSFTGDYSFNFQQTD